MTPHYTDDAVQLYQGDCLDVLRALPDASVHAVVTDPPYGLANTRPEQVAETIAAWIGGDREHLPGGSGFMGKAWDAFVPPVAVWDECLRILKPGGHLLAFAGSRTHDLMALGLRLAGFEIRDSIAWLYGSGFPKSRDVTKAMDDYLAGHPPTDVARVHPAEVYEVTGYLRAARDAAGWSNRQIDALFGTNGMSGHWVSRGTQPAVPSVRQWEILKAELGMGDDVDHLVARLASTERPEDWGTGERADDTFLGTLRKGEDFEPAGGWGTALKPAFEPVVMARRPVEGGSTTRNVTVHGTGALNIDGCRTRMSDEDREKFERGSAAWVAMSERRGQTLADGSTRKAASVYGDYGTETNGPHDKGRWPANVALDDGQAAELDRQSGFTRDGVAVNRNRRSGEQVRHWQGPAEVASREDTGYGGSGGASRFFPTFRYEAKAPTVERPKAGEVAHPTVKPLDLMRWLVRLVTPPGGVVLEPFAGSGTTAEACVIEGKRCIAVEREAEYLPLIVARLAKPIQIGLDLGEVG